MNKVKQSCVLIDYLIGQDFQPCSDAWEETACNFLTQKEDFYSNQSEKHKTGTT